MLRVGVAGALGRLGRVAAAAVESAKDMELVGGFVRNAAHDFALCPLFDDLDAFYGTGMDVVVDCTVYPVSLDVARAALENGVSPVIGATGWTDEDLVAFADACDEAGIGALRIPNFALGAVLMMRFAAEAVRLMPRAEIVEYHHDRKRDAPSGTAKLTAQRMIDAGGPKDVPIHSVRLPGLVAHQATIFGGVGETLTIRHDTLSHESFAAGILLAARSVRAQRGLVSGLDSLVFAEEVR